MSFVDNGVERAGYLFDDGVAALRAIDRGLPATMLELVQAGRLDEAVRMAKAYRGAKVPLASVKLLPPLPRPGKIVCFGLNYVDHAAESGFDKPEYPSIFMRSSTSLAAPGGALTRPQVSVKFDYEGELVAVIGRRGRHISMENAAGFVCAYSCFNDGSVRDFQLRTTQWTIGKNFDSTGAFGPGLVAASDLPPLARGLRLQTRINGAVMQSANTDDMIFPVAEAIAIVSQAMTLEPGDILVLGTPSGVGQSRNPPVFLKHGDVVEVDIEQIGVLRNQVVDEERLDALQEVA
ncbi:fumarylacetoacetate hydrolase family protein [Mesorhizobium sp. CA8]|uniref:fumarylacetoacetate hydrolase family protein n=1 Tax=unclassified Mesorhizobium TaxID=325217 RepID=UPI001CCC1AA3|nr:MULTISPECIES: fumarylacetoacetate hydrolase family protein [unclassified Mesorhizobium]MBZ9761710.1 fumarylacetoacetate hydrolase family protein [Mesorhizobium sp. CA8]MBZ9820536.1 fumarylacetoacetate hydrolase family protein [Mesorhizobium sp. CA4]